jgi:formaldehyde-activating enzyme involved in methanogenesis
MYFYKINNLINQKGNADYKGIDISKIMPGTQVYPQDYKTNNSCLIASTEVKQTNGDLVQITEEEYNTFKQEILSAFQVQPTAEERITLLEQALNDLLLGGM